MFAANTPVLIASYPSHHDEMAAFKNASMTSFCLYSQQLNKYYLPFSYSLLIQLALRDLIKVCCLAAEQKAEKDCKINALN